jgi:hypothetical protein
MRIRGKKESKRREIDRRRNEQGKVVTVVDRKKNGVTVTNRNGGFLDQGPGLGLVIPLVMKRINLVYYSHHHCLI